MASKKLVNHLIKQAIFSDESARTWLQEEHILPISICTTSSTIEFEVWFPEDYILLNEEVEALTTCKLQSK